MTVEDKLRKIQSEREKLLFIFDEIFSNFMDIHRGDDNYSVDYFTQKGLELIKLGVPPFKLSTVPYPVTVSEFFNEGNNKKIAWMNIMKYTFLLYSEVSNLYRDIMYDKSNNKLRYDDDIKIQLLFKIWYGGKLNNSEIEYIKNNYDGLIKYFDIHPVGIPIEWDRPNVKPAQVKRRQTKRYKKKGKSFIY